MAISVNCHLFFIYQVTEKGAQLIDIRHFVADEAQEDNETRAVYCITAICCFVKRLAVRQQHALFATVFIRSKSKKDNRISTQLDALQELMQGSYRLGWLRH